MFDADNTSRLGALHQPAPRVHRVLLLLRTWPGLVVQNLVVLDPFVGKSLQHLLNLATRIAVTWPLGSAGAPRPGRRPTRLSAVHTPGARGPDWAVGGGVPDTVLPSRLTPTTSGNAPPPTRATQARLSPRPGLCAPAGAPRPDEAPRGAAGSCCRGQRVRRGRLASCAQADRKYRSHF